MKEDLDDLLDEIIRLEHYQIRNLSSKDGNNCEPNPSYFHQIKSMYIREWDGIRNPNSIFIPFIFVAIEVRLRRLVDYDHGCGKHPAAVNILDALVGERSPLPRAHEEWRCCIYAAIKKIKDTYYTKQEELHGNSPRNVIMHGNTLLIMAPDKLFSEMLQDYYNLLRIAPNNAIMSLEKGYKSDHAWRWYL